MTEQNKNWRKLRNQFLRQRNPSDIMDVLLELDRMVVEISMRIYNVPQADRLTMRKQNRHLHDTVRTHLPRLLKRSRQEF
jgi:hypothetical protein